MRAGASAFLAVAIATVAPPFAYSNDHGALLSGYTMTSWTLADGIPIGPVHAMVQDAEGYLWLGTTAGVVRFDGARFTPADAIYPDRLPRGDVYALAWSRRGTLWIGFGPLSGGTTVGGLRDGVLTRVSAGSAPKAAATSVLEDHAGRVWAVSDSALHRLRDGRWEVIRHGSLGRATVVSVREDRAGTIWIGTRQGVFRTHDGESFDLVEDGVARETSEGPDGTLWMTDPVHGARRRGARTPLIGIDGLGMRLLHDSRGNLWVATTGQGLWRVRDSASPEVPLIERATTQTGLSNNAVQSLLEDREGNIWVGTMLGLHSLTPQELTPLASGTLVRAVLPDPDGSVWVGTAKGLMRFHDDGRTWRGRVVGKRWDIRSLFRDARGQAWAATAHGLRALRHGQLVELPAPTGVAPPCSAGAIAGLADDTSSASDLRRVVAVSSAAPAAVLRPFCVTRDAVWAAAGGGALTLRRGEHTVASLRSPSPSAAIDQQSVDAIFEDADGTLWAGGTAGLWRVREGRVDQMGEREGLPAQRVMAITQSVDGSLWLAADRGPRHAGGRAALVQLHPSDFDRAVSANTPLAGYRIYDAVNGLAGVPLGPATAARSHDGSLWFVVGGSLTVVNPRQVSHSHERRRAPVLARIVGVNVDDRAPTDTTTSLLPAGTRKIQIDYTALRLTAPRQIRFRYRLDGFDGDWVDAGARRQAYYTNLAPGRYVFRVQANGDGATWTLPEAQWRFTVRHAYWQTAWFYALCGTVLLLAAWGAAQTRIWILNRQFAATLAERTRLSREIHDTMLQSLVGIALQMQAIAQQCPAQGSEQQTRLVALRRQVEEHLREARQAIQHLRSPMLEACGLAGAIGEIGRRTVAPPACFDLSADRIVSASPATAGELLRIAQEGITNAARHAGATRVHVELRQERDVIRLRVTDNGRGFDADAMLSADTGHYGLTGMQERAACIGGQLTVSSSAGGTVVEALVPCVRHRR